MNFTLETSNLRKDFPSGFSLKGVNFQITSPSTFCLLGGNGAGKSTLFRLLTGSLEGESGKVYYNDEVMGVKNHLLKKKIGYLPQEAKLPQWMTAQDALAYAAHLHGLRDTEKIVEEIFDYWDCGAYAQKPLYTCSHGMQKRVGLALASLHDPDYLILDEPFSGLDLAHIYSLENFINKRYNKGKITLLSTHLAPYAASLCSEAGLMEKGQFSVIKEWTSFSYERRMAFMKNYFERPNLVL